MPRQSRGRASAPAPRAAPAQTRSASTAALPSSAATPAKAPTSAAPAAAQAQTSQGPGMMAQMTANAGSVAIGSTIGHGLSRMLFGGSSEAAPVEQAAPVAQSSQASSFCQVQAKDFTTCLEKADLPSCTYYLEQLKACQAAAAPY